jgi:hypothetical protein
MSRMATPASTFTTPKRSAAAAAKKIGMNETTLVIVKKVA